MSIWRLWNWLGLTRTARTAHKLGTSLRRALSEAEIYALGAYNDDRSRGIEHSDEVDTAMLALQDRYDASVRDCEE